MRDLAIVPNRTFSGRTAERRDTMRWGFTKLSHFTKPMLTKARHACSDFVGDLIRAHYVGHTVRQKEVAGMPVVFKQKKQASCD